MTKEWLIKGLDFDKIIFGDFHIHSRFSRACSKDLNVINLVKWARIKGLNLLGTGDFTHEIWLNELKDSLKEDEGIFWYEDSEGKFPFILTSEISLVYSQEGKGRRVHLVYLAPNFQAVDKINSWLDTKGRRDYDGRPIFSISCRDFVAKMKEIDERIEVIPAHIWTPFFGAFGSMSGFDSLEQAFGDMRKNIHGIETGISSDPEMNWKIRDLKNISILSFSDSHSYWPWRLGREATIFNRPEKLTYQEILRQIQENDYFGTVETDPAYGKYHFDGHADCKFSCGPDETKKLNGVCPVCGKKLIVGVEYRVEELSSEGKAEKEKPFFRMLPLHEILSLGLGVGMASKGCWKVYNSLIEKFGNEFFILMNVPEKDLNELIGPKLTELIIRNRNGNISVKPGYDGVYGEALIGKAEKQKKLF